jgi:predicted ArsR family transcriptional regulator
MTRSTNATDGALERARAMAAPSRATIHRLLSVADHPLGVDDLATATELHPTVVRQHLTQLVDAGLVASAPFTPTGRGRPRLGYRAVDEQPYAMLARWLADALVAGVSPRAAGHAAGSRAATDRSDDDPIEVLLAEAWQRGFEPEVRARRAADGRVDIVLRHCPYADLAGDDPGVVCDLHLGLAEGVVAATGGATIEGLRLADPHRGGCRLTVRRAPHGDGGAAQPVSG